MYKIGNTTIELIGIEPQSTSSRLELFRVEKGIPDEKFHISYIDDFHMVQNAVCIYKNSQFAVMKKNNRKLYCYVIDQMIYAVLEEDTPTPKQHQLYLDRTFFSSKIHPYFLPSLLGLERLLIRNQSFILHSSYIALGNNGLLFTAPSGGGKSTQAELWKKYKHATIVNGDKSIVCQNNDQWQTSGLPFSGSSDDCLNKTVPLRAIIILQKATENHITQIGARGFSSVFSQVTVNPWDKDFCSQVMDLVMAACFQIPIILYQCTKEKDAVDTLYDFLINERLLHGIK